MFEHSWHFGRTPLQRDLRWRHTRQARETLFRFEPTASGDDAVCGSMLMAEDSSVGRTIRGSEMQTVPYRKTSSKCLETGIKDQWTPSCLDVEIKCQARRIGSGSQVRLVRLSYPIREVKHYVCLSLYRRSRCSHVLLTTSLPRTSRPHDGPTNRQCPYPFCCDVVSRWITTASRSPDNNGACRQLTHHSCA